MRDQSTRFQLSGVGCRRQRFHLLYTFRVIQSRDNPYLFVAGSIFAYLVSGTEWVLSVFIGRSILRGKRNTTLL